MIKNDKSLAAAKENLQKFKNSLEEMKRRKRAGEGDDLDNDIAIGQFAWEIERIENDIKEYESLKEGSYHCIKPKSLQDIPQCLIKLRIAYGWTQAELGEKVGIAQQAIARYEAEDYVSAGFNRILDIANVFGVKFSFSELIALEIEKEADAFLLPENKIVELVEEDANRTKGALLILEIGT